MPRKILILGDSTSVSIGCEEKTYPYLLSNQPRWSDGTQVVNCSLPGLTAADCCSIFFRDFAKTCREFSDVIMYLGNCDAASNEIDKGRYTNSEYLKHVAVSWFGKKHEKTSLKNKLYHFEWNNTYNQDFESPQEPVNFQYNLERIVKHCLAKGVNVVLVKPKANKLFPPGLGKGNFVFYRFLDLDDKLSKKLIVSDARFLEAYKNHESGSLTKALENYRAILLDLKSAGLSEEYPLIILNNMATIKAELGQLDEAEFLFKVFLTERRSRKEIGYYNLAKVFERKKNDELRDEFMAKSYEADSSMYRIRQPYLAAIDNLKVKYKHMNVVEMGIGYSSDVFLDHCHLLPDGHVKLANDIQMKLIPSTPTGSNCANLVNVLYNPEVREGNFSEFFDYFKTFPDISTREIKKNIDLLAVLLKSSKRENLSSAQLQSFPEAFKSAFEYYVRHPLYGTHAEIVKSPPEIACDVGRFPEFFLVRSMIPFLKEYEEIKQPTLAFSSKYSPLRKSAELAKVLPPRLHDIRFDIPRDLAQKPSQDRVFSIIKAVRTSLLNQLKSGSQIEERIKSTIFWYVRETLRFGGHSRYSMFFDRVSHEYAAEALVVGYLINRKWSMGYDKEILGLAEVLNSAVKTHEMHCKRYAQNPDLFDFQEYEKKIKFVSSNLLALEGFDGCTF